MHFGWALQQHSNVLTNSFASTLKVIVSSFLKGQIVNTLIF
jgi:hypothetical protein